MYLFMFRHCSAFSLWSDAGCLHWSVWHNTLFSNKIKNIHISLTILSTYHPSLVKNIHQWFFPHKMLYDDRWLQVTGCQPFYSPLCPWLKSNNQPFTVLLKYSFPTTVQLEEAEHRFPLVRSLTLHLSWHVSSYHQTSCCSESLSVWLTYINCHSTPRYTWILIQVVTIKTVLTGVSALCVAFV